MHVMVHAFYLAHPLKRRSKAVLFVTLEDNCLDFNKNPINFLTFSTSPYRMGFTLFASLVSFLGFLEETFPTYC